MRKDFTKRSASYEVIMPQRRDDMGIAPATKGGVEDGDDIGEDFNGEN